MGARAGYLSDELELALLGVFAGQVRADGHRGEDALSLDPPRN
jgi:hypothetical protein